MLEGVEKNLVAPLVELLDLLALHVGRAGISELAGKPSRRELARDPLRDKLDALHDQREVGDGNGRRALRHDMPRECDSAALLLCSYNVRQVRPSAAIISAASSGPHDPAA